MMINAKSAAGLAFVMSLSACAHFNSTEVQKYGTIHDIPMIPSTGVSAGVTSTDIIRRPAAPDPSRKSYVMGASNLEEEIEVTSKSTAANFNSFRNALEARLSFGQEETSQLAARMADNLGLTANVDGDAIVVGGASKSETLTFGDAGVLSQGELSACFMKLGTCTVDLEIEGETLPVVVQTGQQNGLWYQSVRSEKPGLFRKSRLLSHTIYSVDASGTLIDLNTVSYATQEPLKQYVRRVR